MIDVIIFVLFIGGFLVGIKRGFVKQIFQLTGFVVSFFVAYLFFDSLAVLLPQWIPYPSLENQEWSLLLDTLQAEMVYYRSIAFATLFFGTKLLWNIVGSMLDLLTDLPILRTLNGWLGGILGLVEVYVIIFFALSLLAVLPMENVQIAVRQSMIAESIVKQTPILSQKLQHLLLQHIA